MSLLPPGYEALEPFVADWALDSAHARSLARTNSSPAAREAFFNAARPLTAKALAELDARPLAEHDEAEKRLMLLLLSLAHVSMAVEVHGADEPAHALWRDRMVITRAPADIPA